MTQFKVGDKVRRKAEYCSECGDKYYAGEPFIITNIDYDTHYNMLSHKDSHKDLAWGRHMSDKVELIHDGDWKYNPYTGEELNTKLYFKDLKPGDNFEWVIPRSACSKNVVVSVGGCWNGWMSDKPNHVYGVKAYMTSCSENEEVVKVD